jgi:deoxyribodipyrimidine photo-lyase
MKTVIHWFRRDLRVVDNTALNEAARRAERVVPVFVLEDALRSGRDVGAARLAFLLRSVEALRESLRELGYPLVVRKGKAQEVLPALAMEVGAEAVWCNKRSEPYAQVRDEKVFNALNRLGVGFETRKDAVIWEEQEILTQSGRPYTVFTPYAKAWRQRRLPAPRPKLPQAQARFGRWRSDPLPTDPGELGHPLQQSLPPTGERVALEGLQRFMSGPVFEYAAQRDYPAVQGTSHLSPHLRAGTVGIRTVLAALAKARRRANPAQQRSCDVFQTELIWREFYHQVLANHPHVTKGAFRSEYDRLQWSESESHFAAWCSGNTGYPIADAAMRCLNATGCMHNRLRMITAMFLTKDLMLNWQWGERAFMRRLVDGDLAANNGGWQWSAGTGTDAAPYFRIFNPTSQGEKFDPEGAFVRQWIPELASVPLRFVHRPWDAPAGTALQGYPSRVVLHEEQRPKCLALFQAVKRPAARHGI